MNSNTAALQTGHHHHHQTSSSNSANSQYHHPSVVNTSTQQSQKPAVNPNPSVHRFNSLNDNNPWLLQSQAQQQQGPTPPLRQHKRPAPHPPPPSTTITQQQQSKANIHLSVNSTYNQPLHFSSAQTQTTPGLVPSSGIHQQHSPKSPNQNFLHQSVGSNLMSTSLSSASSSNMVNSHHHLPPSSHQSLSTSLHHSTSSSLSNNNNNNNNFDDLNLNGTSSISTASSSHQKKLEMKLNTMPWFHGSITRDEAENLLQPRDEGLFLVRESTNYPGDYTLCVCFQGKVEHYRVKYLDKKLTIDDEEYFDNLNQLVAHYEKDADGLCTQLMRPLEKSQPHDILKSGWAIQEQDLQLKESIGKGEFGDVMLGYYKGDRVAVKVLKDSTAAAQKFVEEASVMAGLEHQNLVKFLGLVFNEQHVYLVTEYMSKGSLVDYLRSRGRQHITRKDQINFASDTCAGMEYLEAKKVVHRDLAARNVLISEDCIAKVADFGLARGEICINNTTDIGKLPIKWTAPEALKSCRFSNKSDIWSFGILLWEIYSFGRVPYPRIPLAEVTKHVEMGYKMEAPEGCPTEIYDMMKQTWDLNPSKRPNFHELSAKLIHLKSITT